MRQVKGLGADDAFQPEDEAERNVLGGLGLCVALNLAWYVIAALSGTDLWALCGFAQPLYVGPVWLVLVRKRKRAMAKGLIFGAVAMLGVNLVTCYGMLQAFRGNR
jgi:hypothetical protein